MRGGYLGGEAQPWRISSSREVYSISNDSRHSLVYSALLFGMQAGDGIGFRFGIMVLDAGVECSVIMSTHEPEI